MLKRLLAASALAAVTLVTLSARSSSGGPPEPEATCYPMTYATPSGSPPLIDLTYSTQQGVLLRFPQDGRIVTAHLPLEVGGDPNPHFDRMYALLMKGIDSQRIEQVCVDRAPSGDGTPVELVSLTLEHVEPPRPAPPPEVQRVMICDDLNPTRCANVSWQGRLEVLPPN